MIKPSLLAFAACALAATPALAEDVTAPGTLGKTCYVLTVPGMTGQWTLNAALRFSKSHNHVVGRATCTRATTERPVRSFVTGNYFTYGKGLVVVAKGDAITGPDQANSGFAFRIPPGGPAGTASFSCRNTKGIWSHYDTAAVTEIACPATKPAKK